MTISNAIATNNYDIMCNSETWLVQEVPDEALFLPDDYESHITEKLD